MANLGDLSGGTSKITSGIELNALVKETLEFFRRHLSDWRDDPERKEEESEEKLNGSLCDYLNYRARHDYPMALFHHEEFQTGRRRIDLSVKTESLIVAETRKFTKYDPYLVIEGKRLPAPTADREKEYVTGFGEVKGGIQRFKLGLHGASLEIAAMVAYIQDDDHDGWLVRINGWISSLSGTDCSDGCHWSETERIGDYRLTKRARIASGKSKHPRTASSSPDIDIYHFWVSMRRKRTRTKKAGNDGA
jgi:hypothetical protein